MSDLPPDSTRPPMTPAVSDVGSRTPHDRTSRLVMRTRTFTARTVGECLQMAKRELGVEAMILSKKTFRKGGFLGKWGGREMVEVTFGTYRPADSAPKPTNAPSPNGVGKSVPPPSANGTGTTDTPADFAARLAELSAASAPPPDAAPPPAAPQEAPLTPNFGGARPAEPFVFAPVQAKDAAPPEADRAINYPSGGPAANTPSGREDNSVVRQDALAAPAAPQTGNLLPGTEGGLDKETLIPVPVEEKPLPMIRRVRAGFTRPSSAPTAPYPGLLQALLDAEVAPAVARSLVDEMPPDLPAPDAAAHLRTVISGRIRIFHPLRIETGREMRMMAFFGPTGVGKTLSVVKLAAQYALVERRTVGIVTLDTQRIAAAQQLQTYGQILRVPVHVAQDRADVVRLLTEMRNTGTEVTLLDTPGRSPNDMLPLGETGHVFDEMGAIQKFLLLPAGLTLADMENAVARFGSITTPDALILSKLDETSDSTCFGRLLTMQARHGLPLAYVTTGQRVPDDILFPDAGAIAARLLLAPALAP